eukprot:1941077-Pleurochrysis_carterae.AAC.1
MPYHVTRDHRVTGYLTRQVQVECCRSLRAVLGRLFYALSLATRSGPFHRPEPHANSCIAPCAVPHRAPCATRAIRAMR